MNICFTGHRPNKLGGYDWTTEKNKRIIEKLKNLIISVTNDVSDKVIYFRFGAALGIDQMAFEIVYNIIKPMFSNKIILLEIAVPYKNQYIKWSKDDIDLYMNQLKKADYVTYVDEMEHYNTHTTRIGEHSNQKLQMRNQYMVDYSDILIGVWNNINKGGTSNCINYAKKLNRKIILMNPEEC